MDFMGKVNEISKKVGEVAEKTFNSAKDKSGKLIEETKLKIKVAENEKDIKEVYEKIGRTVYNAGPNKTFAKDIKEIDKMMKEIEEMETTILHLKNLRKCDNCNATISMSDKFCTICGEAQKPVKIKVEKKKVEEEVEDEKPFSKACKKCGKVVDSDVKFCPKCGYEFK